MRTEGFCKKIVALALAIGLSARSPAGIRATHFRRFCLRASPVRSNLFLWVLSRTIHWPSQPFAFPRQNRVTRSSVISVERPSRRAWLALSIVQHGAAAFDAYSTRDAISHGAVENDPLMRPFAHSPAMYAANQVGPLVLDLVARRMQRSDNSFLRRMWWVPQSAAAADFIFCGVHNLHVANQP